jgi:Lon protease-like protein
MGSKSRSVVNLALFPLHTVLFPGMALPLHIFEPRYRKLVSLCLETNSPFGVVLIRAGAEVGAPAVPHPVGTLARIARAERLPDGRLNIEAVGEERFKVVTLDSDEAGYLTGTVEHFPLLEAAEPPARQAAARLAPWLARYIALLGKAAATRFARKRLPADPAALAYLAAIVAQIPMLEKQALLSVEAAPDLLGRERVLFRREVSLLRSMLASASRQSRSNFCPN